VARYKGHLFQSIPVGKLFHADRQLFPTQMDPESEGKTGKKHKNNK
jgi:hypothetical protein